MEQVLSNGFCEMSSTEVQETNGGVAHVAVLVLVSVAWMGFNVGVAINNDLTNCYNNGYNEVMSNNKK